MLPITVALALGGRPKLVDVELSLPTDQPAERATYRSGVSTWHPRNKRAGPLVSNDPWLTCTTEGRWLHTEVAFDAETFPSLPTSGSCGNERMLVTVTLTGPAR